MLKEPFWEREGKEESVSDKWREGNREWEGDKKGKGERKQNNRRERKGGGGGRQSKRMRAKRIREQSGEVKEEGEKGQERQRKTAGCTAGLTNMGHQFRGNLDISTGSSNIHRGTDSLFTY